jgi:uncharacterized membrane protein
MSWSFIIVCGLICGAIAAVIGQKKNRGTGESFVLGAIFGVIGIIIVLIQRAIKCPRCNTVQNFPRNITDGI